MSWIGKLLGSGVGATVESIANTIDRFIETPEEKKAFEIVKKKLDDKRKEWQIELNKVEAGHRSIFIAGWRPFIGWTCGAGLAITYIVNPLLLWTAEFLNKTVTVPDIDMNTLMPLILAMLGIGGLRSFEKSRGLTK